jgi:hypothetical protein
MWRTKHRQIRRYEQGESCRWLDVCDTPPGPQPSARGRRLAHDADQPCRRPRLAHPAAGDADGPLRRLEALAHSTIKLNRCTSADELAMDPQVAEAVLEFADDLRTARAASGAWAETKGLVHPSEPADSEDDA